ncbi:hypothetical protein H0O02_04085, partial [Candidatus Micrarchaeota archaeon]|nr:hypothetical protein [Candidatus Micrarchaeota archaeon]
MKSTYVLLALGLLLLSFGCISLPGATQADGQQYYGEEAPKSAPNEPYAPSYNDGGAASGSERMAILSGSISLV